MFRPVQQTIIPVLFLACLTGVTLASPPSFWEVSGYDDFEGGEFDGVTLLPSGALLPGPRLEDIRLPAADYAWAATRGPEGAVYVTTGSPGRLVRIDGGSIDILHEEPAADLPALVVTPDGTLYVGTAPGGAVLRVDRENGASVVCETGQGYIWDMTWSEEYGLIVATGDSARVLAVDGRGRTTLLADSREASFVSLAAGEGRVLAGTSPGGMLLDVTPGEDPTVLYDTRYDEVTGIVIEPEAVSFSASSILFEEALGDESTFDQSFGEGGVFRMPYGGAAIEMWQSLDAPVTSLGRGAGGGLWAGAGTGGNIHELDSGRASLVARCPSEEVLTIRGNGEEALIAAGLPAAVWIARDGGGARGVYRSDVLDAGPEAMWGEIAWRAEAPGRSGVALSTRSGNTASPDGTWSDWTEVEGEDAGAVPSPSARFLQWRAILERGRGGDMPSLFEVLVAYIGGNRPPVLESVSVFEPADAITEGEGGYGATAARQIFPSGLEVTYNLEAAREGRGVGGPATGLRTVEWRAYDPDGDRLMFDVRVRSDDEKNWKPLASDVARSAHTWDSRAMQDGHYTILVEASDEQDRPGRPLTATIVSEPFLVDNGRPVVDGVSVEERDDRLHVTGRAGDALSPLIAVDVAVDYGEWSTADADDGLVDSREEYFSLSVPHPGAGEHRVAVRAVDRQGNTRVVGKTVRLR
ncbi:MAG: hypothetical protein GF405_09180 [Candidatus Eisenbacteria bacterium]|nr:hypothetical protein [Candidatus Eisenbacteria bacterium]